MQKDIKINKTISIPEKISAINSIVNSCFHVDEETNIICYTPYFKELAEILVFANYFLSGVILEEDKYEAIKSNKKLMRLYKKNRNHNKCFKEIIKSADLIVSYKRDKLVHDNPLNELFNEITKIIKNTDSKSFVDIANKLNSLEKTNDNLQNDRNVNDKNFVEC